MLQHSASETYRFRIAGHGRGDAGAVASILAECLRRQGFTCAEPTAPQSAAMLPLQPEQVEQVEVVVGGQGKTATGIPEHMFILLDEDLLSEPAFLSDLSSESTLLVATGHSPALVKEKLGRQTKVVATVDNTELAVQHGADWAAPILGAVARLTGLVDPDCLCPTVWAAYDREFPYLAAAAIRACDAGYEKVSF